jgi:hypothetical protein
MKRWVLISLLPLAVVFDVRAQFTTGLNISKTCPSTPVAPGSVFTCTFSVTNLDAANSVTSLAVTNTVPFPAGSPAAVPCTQASVPVSVLGPNGTATDTCTGSIDETAPACGPTDIIFSDQVAATGNDTNGGGTPLPVSASTTNAVVILACAPNVPVPTLSVPLLALLALGLSAAGLFVMRRQ